MPLTHDELTALYELLYQQQESLRLLAAWAEAIAKCTEQAVVEVQREKDTHDPYP